MVQHFNEIFKSNPEELDPVLNCIEEKISESKNDILLRRVSLDEVRSAVFGMHPDKTPGPDGLNSGFYQAFWDILSQDLVKLCDSFIQIGRLPPSLNHTQIVLIPKRAKPDTMGDLRPISLCNVIYKILAKVLTNRLKPLLGHIISDNQSVFIPRRLITDNVMLAFES